LNFSNLLSDGAHEIRLVKNPDLSKDGVVVLDDMSLDKVSGLDLDGERCVVVTRKRPPEFTRLWRDGIRHIISSADPPSVAQMAVLAAELHISEYMYS
jgi:hypothetical protein